MTRILSFVVAFATVLVVAGCQDESGTPVGVRGGPPGDLAQVEDFAQVDVAGPPIKIVPPSGAAARSLALASLTGIQIAYDLSHDTGRQSLTSPTGTNLNSIIFGDLTAAGATITVINAFTPAVLSGFDVLWLEEDFNTALSPTEKVTLNNFVAAGGAVLMCCEEWALFSDHGSPLGVFGFGYTSFSKSGISTNINPHPTTAGVASVDFPASAYSLTLPGQAISLVLEPGGTQTEVAIDGSGRVVVLSDELCINAAVNDADNRLLCNQLVDFIAQPLAGQKVSGGVHVDLSALSPDFHEHFAFNAVRHQDGTVTGEFQIIDTNVFFFEGTFPVHGDVTCFSILADGKTAWLGGVLEQNAFGLPAGSEAAWTVVDNGEGKNAPPDEATDLTFGLAPGAAALNCATGIAINNIPPTPILNGNIQVKP